jgi:rod shape-determining protein MreD
MTWRTGVLPTLSIFALTLAAVLPWGLSSNYRFVLPLLPVVAIYYWVLDRDAWLPEWIVFVAGLMLDILTQGPLGYWALVYLVAYVAGVYCSRINADTAVSEVAILGSAIVAVTFVAWLSASIYFLDVLDWVPYARGALFALAISILVRFGLGMSRTGARSGVSLRLTRRD